MIISYKISFNDMLTQQLYTITQSAIYKQRNKRSRLMVPILYTVMGLVFTQKEGSLYVGIILIALGAIWYIYHPKFMRFRYVKYYTKNINNNYSQSINKDVSFEVLEDSIVLKSEGSETKISESELVSLTELQDLLLIRLVTNSYLVIPKQGIENIEDFKNELCKLDITYTKDLNWVW